LQTGHCLLSEENRTHCRDTIYEWNRLPHLKRKCNKTYIDLMQRKTFKLFAGKNSPPYLCTPQKREFIRRLADG
jgi:hypothetical protein